MNVVQTILNVRGEASLEKAVAMEVGNEDDKDLQADFLQQLSVDYGPKTRKVKTVTTDNLDNGGQDFNTDDTNKKTSQE